MCLRALIHVTQTPKRRNSCTHDSKAIYIRDEILDLITSMSRSAWEAELRPRIAQHLSGRVRPSGRIHVIFLVKMSIYLAKSENNAYLGTIFTA